MSRSKMVAVLAVLSAFTASAFAKSPCESSSRYTKSPSGWVLGAGFASSNTDLGSNSKAKSETAGVPEAILEIYSGGNYFLDYLKLKAKKFNENSGIRAEIDTAFLDDFLYNHDVPLGCAISETVIYFDENEATFPDALTQNKTQERKVVGVETFWGLLAVQQEEWKGFQHTSVGQGTFDSKFVLAKFELDLKKIFKGMRNWGIKPPTFGSVDPIVSYGVGSGKGKVSNTFFSFDTDVKYRSFSAGLRAGRVLGGELFLIVKKSEYDITLKNQVGSIPLIESTDTEKYVEYLYRF